MDLPVNYDETPPPKRRMVREAYVKVQRGSCYHCENPLHGRPSKTVKDLWIDKSLFPEGFFNNPVHLHHNHETGMTIGAVHCHCNAVLWQYHGE